MRISSRINRGNTPLPPVVEVRASRLGSMHEWAESPAPASLDCEYCGVLQYLEVPGLAAESLALVSGEAHGSSCPLRGGFYAVPHDTCLRESVLRFAGAER